MATRQQTLSTKFPDDAWRRHQPKCWITSTPWLGRVYILHTRSSSWWRHQINSALLALCEGNSPFTGEFPSQRSCSDAKLWCFLDLRLDIRLSKQSIHWWFETPSRPIWRHCNAKGSITGLYQMWRTSVVQHTDRKQLHELRSRPPVDHTFKSNVLNNNVWVLCRGTLFPGSNRMVWQWAETLVEIRGTLADIRGTTK